VVEELLVNYYDPMYDYQIKKKISRVVFKGNSDEVLAYLSQLRRCSILASNKMSSACLVLACIQSGICSAPIFEPSSSNNKVERYNALLKLVNNALSKYKEQGDHTDFYPVVEELLVNLLNHSCRQGHCGLCILQLLSGDVMHQDW
jgi:acyl-coenzyme A synthetase/AMP-(fatty) acid ligase